MNDLVLFRPPPSPLRGLMHFRPPVMGICRNPLVGIHARDMHEVPVGVRLRDFVIEANGPVVCCKNGEWLLREHWDELTAPGDVIVWHVMLQGREVVRVLLQVVAAIVSIYAPYLAPYAAAAVLAFNLLVPPRQPNVNNDTPGSIFSIGLAGNAARVDQPIWKNCGHCKITPPFASIPYFINLPRAGATKPFLDTEQYGYFLYAVGLGEDEIVRALIGKTPVGHLQDIIVAEYLPPGVAPSVVEGNVLTSTEVSDLELETDSNGDGIYVGGYVACRPLDRALKIGIDVSAPEGLGHILNSGDSEDLVVAWQVDIREIDDFGVPLGEWIPIGNESQEMDTNSLQRWSYLYTLSAPVRCEVRLFRTNEKNRDSDARDKIVWSGLRAHLEAPATLNPDAGHYELVIRAGNQLTPESQRDFSLILNGKCPVWDPDTETFSAPVVTRNPSHWAVDLWRSTVWGEGLPDTRVDLIGMAEWADTCDDRQDHFDFSFAQGIDAAEASQLIARCGRGRASSPLGLRTVTRDELVTVPLTAFSARNTQPDTITQASELPGRDAPERIIVTYQDHRRWDLMEVEEPIPGATSNLGAPLFIHLDGVIGSFQARREARYMAAKMAYRGTKFSLTTEMEGQLRRHLDTVRLMPDLPEYGKTGDVAFWDEGSLTMGLTEPVDFSVTPVYLTLRRDDGSLTDPVAVDPGNPSNFVILPEAPDFEIVIEDGSRERPVYFIGPASSDELCKIEEISDGGREDGAQLFDLKLVIDDPRVHSADLDLLPGPGEIQDPIDDGTDVPDTGGGGTTATLVRLSDHGITGGNVGIPDDTHRGGLAGFTLFANGKAGFSHADDFTTVGSPTTGFYTREWLNTAPVEPAVAALYECYADDLGGVATFTANGAIAAGMVITGTFGSWLPMTADRAWSIQADDAVSSALFGPQSVTLAIRIRIRRIDSGVVQATRTISLEVVLGNSPP